MEGLTADTKRCIAAGGGQQADAFRRMHMQRLMEQRQQEAQLSREVRVQKFKQLLVDSGVNAFSFYAKVRSQHHTDDRMLVAPANSDASLCHRWLCLQC